MSLGGPPVRLEAKYRVTVNSFLADGGDAFSVLVRGESRVGGGLDLDALLGYLGGRAVSPPSPGRIVRR